MLTSPPSAVAQKRDLHVGGLGASASGALAAVSGPVEDAAGKWLRRARSAARDADDFVRGNPWAALAVVGCIALAAGYLYRDAAPRPRRGIKSLW